MRLLSLKLCIKNVEINNLIWNWTPAHKLYVRVLAVGDKGPAKRIVNIQSGWLIRLRNKVWRLFVWRHVHIVSKVIIQKKNIAYSPAAHPSQNTSVVRIFTLIALTTLFIAIFQLLYLFSKRYYKLHVSIITVFKDHNMSMCCLYMNLNNSQTSLDKTG